MRKSIAITPASGLTNEATSTSMDDREVKNPLIVREHLHIIPGFPKGDPVRPWGLPLTAACMGGKPCYARTGATRNACALRNSRRREFRKLASPSSSQFGGSARSSPQAEQSKTTFVYLYAVSWGVPREQKPSSPPFTSLRNVRSLMKGGRSLQPPESHSGREVPAGSLSTAARERSADPRPTNLPWRKKATPSRRKTPSSSQNASSPYARVSVRTDHQSGRFKRSR